MTKSRPILYTAAMVNALLRDDKTETRRVVKPQPTPYMDGLINWHYKGRSLVGATLDRLVDFVPCPYGKPGDTLWVRETCQIYGFWVPNGKTPTGRTKMRFVEHHSKQVAYAEDKQQEGRKDGTDGWHTRPSILMPRWASRILLEIISAGAERLQDISEQDAKAEGVRQGFRTAVMQTVGPSSYHIPLSYRGGYANLWNKINGPSAWESNPVVWVIKFKKVWNNGN